ncbi:nitrate reductase molybdenum cofactor assembly chaperone [Shewanella nanhaiensis]|uniref:Nitrate reductase molybdenum cofactor assembly chaperone n=1 Tax=Shewanella nanhaiensis TaxID=2864872 RepID=A0ABS7E5B0_9GAMM|nr:nitrate reductase molybdenum cofactor assembly chaperone [Shewanella nanhaiensis]MBW8184881.1 nitrate reductase molybdenum cofactor assembly chaperone [Shewanella nanhaiensis]
MLLLKVISHLLDYPTQALFDAKDELLCVVEQSDISVETQTGLTGFICELTQRDLYDVQESYDLLFDRGRALSLLLFEHVHGESRDRGQAMVDLMNVYKANGFEVDSSQLPDYIPLYLEFLSLQTPEFIQEWLGDISHILTMLSERLKERDCYYKVLLDSLIEVSGVEVERAEIAQAVSKEERDDTVEAIDKEWEDREIRFDDPAVGQCPSAGIQQSQNALDPNTVHQVPIKWHEADAAQVSGL